MKSYKEIFDSVVSTYNYDYVVLYEEDIEELVEKIYDDNLAEIHFRILNSLNQSMYEFDAVDCIAKLIMIRNEISLSEFLRLKNIYLKISSLQGSLQIIKNNYDEEAYYGTCDDFAKEFVTLCSQNGLKAKYVEGTIDINGRTCLHAWNSVKENGKTKYIDISGAIHSRDGLTITDNMYDYFMIDLEDFYFLDGNTTRRISKEYSNIKKIGR